MGKYLKKDIIEEIRHIVEYMWRNEEKNWYECEKSDRNNHIFNSLCKINNALDFNIKRDEDYDEDYDE